MTTPFTAPVNEYLALNGRWLKKRSRSEEGNDLNIQTRWKADDAGARPRQDTIDVWVREEKHSLTHEGDAAAIGTPAKQASEVIERLLNTHAIHRGGTDDAEKPTKRIQIQPGMKRIGIADESNVCATWSELEVSGNPAQIAEVHGPTARTVLETIANHDAERRVERWVAPDSATVVIREIGGRHSTAWLTRR